MNKDKAHGGRHMEVRTLQDLLAPIDQREFLDRYYGKKPLHVIAAGARLAHLLPWDALNQVLLQHRLEAPRVRFAKDGRATPLGKSDKPDGRQNVMRLNYEEVLSKLRDGATLIVDQVDEMYAPITALCRELEYVLGEYTSANAYAGWNVTQGFDTHWDPHDVIIAQVAGHKRWRIFEPERKHPVEEDKRDTKLKLEPPKEQPYWEGTLSPGDALYIPRGWWHDATPVGEPTLHVTLTTQKRNGLNMISWLFRKLRDEEVLRADLPRHATSETRQEHTSRIQKAVQRYLAEASVDTYLRTFDSEANSRFRPTLPLLAMREVNDILGESSWLHWLPPRPVTIAETAEDEIVFEALSSTFRFQRVARPVVENLAHERHIRFDALCANHQTVDPEAIKDFMGELVTTGLVAVSLTRSV